MAIEAWARRIWRRRELTDMQTNQRPRTHSCMSERTRPARIVAAAKLSDKHRNWANLVEKDLFSSSFFQYYEAKKKPVVLFLFREAVMSSDRNIAFSVAASLSFMSLSPFRRRIKMCLLAQWAFVRSFSLSPAARLRRSSERASERAAHFFPAPCQCRRRRRFCERNRGELAS